MVHRRNLEGDIYRRNRFPNPNHTAEDRYRWAQTADEKGTNAFTMTLRPLLDQG